MIDILHNYIIGGIYKSEDDWLYNKCIGCKSDVLYKTSLISPINKSGGPPYCKNNIKICQLLYNEIILYPYKIFLMIQLPIVYDVIKLIIHNLLHLNYDCPGKILSNRRLILNKNYNYCTSLDARYFNNVHMMNY